MFSFNDAIGFRLVTQQEDTNAKIQVFVGVFAGVILRWIYSVAVEVIRERAVRGLGDLGVGQADARSEEHTSELQSRC